MPTAALLRTLAALSGGGPVFPYSRTTVREWWEQICGAAAITGVTLHGLRATFITRGLDAGVPPVEVQKLVGHAELSVTMKYYRNPEQSQSAADRIRQAVGLGGKEVSDERSPSVSPSASVLPNSVAGR